MEKLITNEMAEVVFGSNRFERLGLNLDETLRLCMLVFSGEEGLENVERYVFDLFPDLHINVHMNFHMANHVVKL